MCFLGSQNKKKEKKPCFLHSKFSGLGNCQLELETAGSFIGASQEAVPRLGGLLVASAEKLLVSRHRCVRKEQRGETVGLWVNSEAGKPRARAAPH